MNIGQMHLEFKLSMDKLYSGAYPEMLVEQIDYLLNEAINRFVKTRYGKNNIYQQSFEEIQKRTADLRTLVVTNYPAISTNINEENTITASLSTIYTNEGLSVLSTDTYWFLLRIRARVVKTGCTSRYMPVKMYSLDDMNDVLFDPYKRPIIMESVGFEDGGNINVMSDGTYTIDRVKLTYLKEPATVRYGTTYPTPTTDVDCDLPKETHKEVIALATTIALENIESQRLQTQLEVAKNIE